MDWNAFFAVVTVSLALVSTVCGLIFLFTATVSEYATDATIHKCWLGFWSCLIILIISVSTISGMGWIR